MDPPPTRDREVLEPETRAFPDADDPETSRSESDEGIPPPPPPPALRQQLMGACRADERLRPLLTLNVSCAAADDRFIAHLAQVPCLLLGCLGFTDLFIHSARSLPPSLAALRGVGGGHARALPLRPPRLPARWQGSEGRASPLPNTH